jgi:hypothetical protein
VTTDLENDEIIIQVVDRLADKNPELERDRIEAVVREELDKLAGRPVRDYLSVLTERAAKKRLKRD